MQPTCGLCNYYIVWKSQGKLVGKRSKNGGHLQRTVWILSRLPARAVVQLEELCNREPRVVGEWHKREFLAGIIGNIEVLV